MKPISTLVLAGALLAALAATAEARISLNRIALNSLSTTAAQIAGQGAVNDVVAVTLPSGAVVTR